MGTGIEIVGTFWGRDCMPQKAHIDAPGSMHHLIVRGTERDKIFEDDADRESFVERLGQVSIDTCTDYFAWALVPNSVHLLLNLGPVPISTENI